MVRSTLNLELIRNLNYESFQLEIQNLLVCRGSSVDEYNIGFVETVHTVGFGFFKTRRTDKFKRPYPTLKFIKKRRKMILQPSDDACKCSTTQYSSILEKRPTLLHTDKIKDAVEWNKSSKVFISGREDRRRQNPIRQIGASGRD